jgi:hypothetical protein
MPRMQRSESNDADRPRLHVSTPNNECVNSLELHSLNPGYVLYISAIPLQSSTSSCVRRLHHSLFAPSGSTTAPLCFRIPTLSTATSRTRRIVTPRPLVATLFTESDKTSTTQITKAKLNNTSFPTQDVRLHPLRLSNMRPLLDLHVTTLWLPRRPPQLPLPANLPNPHRTTLHLPSVQRRFRRPRNHRDGPGTVGLQPDDPEPRWW